MRCCAAPLLTPPPFYFCFWSPFCRFDQMCINLANERLHHFFNQHIFKSEIEEYKAEGVEGAESVFFDDNDKILNLFFS